MDRSPRLGWTLVVIGAAAALFVQATSPLPGPPLFDGVIVVEPYLWLEPPPEQLGGAEGVSDTIAVGPNGNEQVIVYTDELPPQAQVFGTAGSLNLPDGATSINVSITPVAPPGAPPDGSYIDGNVYRFDLTDQAGGAITADPAASVTIILRSADVFLFDGTIERFDGSGWRALSADRDPMTSAFHAIVTEFGDFAVIAPGVSPYEAAPTVPPTSAAEPPAAPPAATSEPTASSNQPPAPVPLEPAVATVVGVIVVAALAAVVALAIWRRRRRYDDRGWRR